MTVEGPSVGSPMPDVAEEAGEFQRERRSALLLRDPLESVENAIASLGS